MVMSFLYQMYKRIFNVQEDEEIEEKKAVKLVKITADSLETVTFA